MSNEIYIIDNTANNIIITLKLEKINKKICLLLLTSPMQTQLSITCECYQEEKNSSREQ